MLNKSNVIKSIMFDHEMKYTKYLLYIHINNYNIIISLSEMCHKIITKLICVLKYK